MTFDSDDKIIVARVLDVDDIITTHGESVAEFEANFHAAIDDYITACETLCGAPEEPASGKLSCVVAGRAGASVHGIRASSAFRSARRPARRHRAL